MFNTRGFTLVELLVVLAITTTLFSLTFMNIGNLQHSTYIDSTLETLLSDIKSQQLKAMTSDTSATGANTPYGVYFETGRYVLFMGSSYNAAASTNFPISLENAITVTSTFPSSQLVFLKGSGEIQTYTAGLNTITIQNTVTNTQKQITLNRYGAIISIN